METKCQGCQFVSDLDASIFNVHVCQKPVYIAIRLACASLFPYRDKVEISIPNFSHMLHAHLIL